MLSKLKNRVKAMDAVYRFCLNNPSVVSLLAFLGVSVNALGVKIQSIRSKEALQELNNKGVTTDKQIKKANMVTICSAMAEAGQAFAAEKGDNSLFTNLYYPAATILGGVGETAISKSQKVHDLLAEIPLAERTPVGLTDASLKAMQDSISDFSDDLSSTNIIRADRKNYTKDLTVLVNEGSFIMRKRILKAAKQLAPTHPDFYNSLVSLAKVVNSHTHTKARFEVFNDTTQKPLPGVTVAIKQTGESAVTSKRGACSIYLPFGDYTVELTHDKFITMNLDVKVKRGSNTVHVDMSPEFILPAAVTEKKMVTVEK